jgi:hypothetical protein
VNFDVRPRSNPVRQVAGYVGHIADIDLDGRLWADVYAFSAAFAVIPNECLLIHHLNCLVSAGWYACTTTDTVFIDRDLQAGQPFKCISERGWPHAHSRPDGAAAIAAETNGQHLPIRDPQDVCVKSSVNDERFQPQVHCAADVDQCLSRTDRFCQGGMDFPSALP